MKAYSGANHNGTEATEFILLGLSTKPELQPILFLLFLMIYLITLTGNFGMILLIRFTPRLQTPMYFFLTHLACVDIFYSTNVSPQMLVHFLSEKKTISYIGCLTQCFVFVTLLLTEYYMLGAMAYDRYMAICNPLLNSTALECIWLPFAFVVQSLGCSGSLCEDRWYKILPVVIKEMQHLLP